MSNDIEIGGVSLSSLTDEQLRIARDECERILYERNNIGHYDKPIRRATCSNCNDEDVCIRLGCIVNGDPIIL